jgi:hypothetical protein
VGRISNERTTSSTTRAACEIDNLTDLSQGDGAGSSQRCNTYGVSRSVRSRVAGLSHSIATTDGTRA